MVIGVVVVAVVVALLWQVFDLWGCSTWWLMATGLAAVIVVMTPSMDGLFFSSSLCSTFTTSFVPILDHSLWLILVDSSCTIMTHPRTPILGPEGCTMTHGPTPWLILVCTHIYYKLWLFNYKYHVVAVVRPQSCLRPLLAIQVIPLYLCLAWATMPSSWPWNHWTTEPLHPQLPHSHQAYQDPARSWQLWW